MVQYSIFAEQRTTPTSKLMTEIFGKMTSAKYYKTTCRGVFECKNNDCPFFKRFNIIQQGQGKIIYFQQIQVFKFFF